MVLARRASRFRAWTDEAARGAAPRWGLPASQICSVSTSFATWPKSFTPRFR